jgi:hypothetical protein
MKTLNLKISRIPAGLALMALLFSLSTVPAARAQDDTPETAPEGGSSQQVEESDEAFRRRMELEDARHRDPGFSDPATSYKQDLEKIDKLPVESRDNIRDQLIEIIMENGDWEPSDALEEYPYRPTAAAQADPDLMQKEQEAWDEQIEKYHARESEAFGAYRGPVSGPGNPNGPEGGQGGEGSQQGEQGEQEGGEKAGQQGDGGQQGQQGSEGSEQAQNQAGTYEPYQPGNNDSSEKVSTAGVSESALDFLRSRQQTQAGQAQGQAQQNQAQQDQAQQPQIEENQSQAQARQTAQQSSQQETEPAEDPDMRGIIAIEDLDKLRGTSAPPPPEEEEENP